jgi:hypothetical protein
MNKNMKKRTRGKRAGRSAKHIPDSQIDFSDIPESTDEELKRARRVGRPASGSCKAAYRDSRRSEAAGIPASNGNQARQIAPDFYP